MNLPSAVPTPKFQLFQQVYVTPKEPTRKKDEPKPRIGVVVGMEYITLFSALACHYARYGWEYKVDFYFGAPYEAALACSDPVQVFEESELISAIEHPEVA